MGSILDIGNSIDRASGGAGTFFENLLLGRALAYSMAVMAPMALCIGFGAGYIFAFFYNQLGGSVDLVKIREDAIRYK